jgi:hypothetical protein
MSPVNRFLLVSLSIVGLLATAGHAQVPQPGRGGRAGGSPSGGPVFPPLMQTPPRPAIANAKPVRSCESLAAVALPNTTIESATIDTANAGICRVTAIATHPPTGDKVRIWIALPTSN